MTSLYTRLGIPVLVFVLAFVPFLPALPGEFLNWDDVAFIVDNPNWRGLSGAHLAWMLTTFEAGHYQPLSWLSLAIDHALWGMDSRGYHLTNQLLHAINAVLLYFIILTLLRSATVRDRIAAAIGALLFAVHPLRVEAVAWITERRDLLSTAFLLAALLAYLCAVHDGVAARRWHALGILLFAASLLAKAWGMTFAFVLLVLDLWVLRRPLSKPLLLEKLPYVALGLAAAGAAVAAQRSAGATAELTDHGWVERLLQAGYGVCFYLVKTLVPVGLSPLYLIEEQRDLWEVPLYPSALLAATAVTVLVVLERHRRPWLFAAWACYLIIVSPVLGVVQSGAQLVADRYSYLSCMPWAVLAAAGLAMGLRAPGAREGRRVAAVATAGGAALVVLGLAALTARQSAYWQNTFSLWDQAVRAQPTNYVALTNRANARLQMAQERAPGRPPDERSRRLLRAAVDDYDRSIALAPGFGWAYASRGLAHLALGEYEAAVRDFDVAIELVGPDPDMVQRRGEAHQALLQERK